ncbi:MAG TPA: N-6 DNA methylase [Ktedonobacteraceae bacterium]|nr:N-6 DNA methylase [Ktedonobacteraceae bacterium]
MVQTPQHNVFGWYEASLPQAERKQRGHFSTPARLVEYILDACGYIPTSDLSRIRVLDPACGSGNFLAGAARRLVTSPVGTDLSRPHPSSYYPEPDTAQSPQTPQPVNRHKILQHVQRNLWGFDPDPIACFLAEMQLCETVQRATGGVFPRNTHLHIHQADGLALPWEMCEEVDLFLANPPYLATKNNDLSGYRLSRSGGQTDSYLLFLEMAVRIVRPGGWLGIVLPDPVLARANASRERTRLLETFTIHHLWHLANVFNAQVGAVVLVAQKCSPSSTHKIAWVREKWSRVENTFNTRENKHEQPGYPQGDTVYSRGIPLRVPWQPGPLSATVPQSLFLQQPHAEFRYLLNSEQGLIIEQLRSVWDASSTVKQNFAPLNTFLSIRRGEELGRENSRLIPVLTSLSESQLPVLRGGVDIRPYVTPAAQCCIAREAVAKPLTRYLAPKLLVVKSTHRLQATLDIKGHVALQTLYLLHPLLEDESGDELYFFLALLNSRLLQEYVYTLYTAYKWVQPQIEQHVLAQLPVPVIASDCKREIIERARNIVVACDKSSPVVEWNESIRCLYAEQERAIRMYYASALPGLFH